MNFHGIVKHIPFICCFCTEKMSKMSNVIAAELLFSPSFSFHITIPSYFQATVWINACLFDSISPKRRRRMCDNKTRRRINCFWVANKLPWKMFVHFCFFFLFFRSHLTQSFASELVQTKLTFFNFGWSSKFAFPPWTVMSNFGNSKFHSRVNSCTNSSGLVSYDNLTYCLFHPEAISNDATSR